MYVYYSTSCVGVVLFSPSQIELIEEGPPRRLRVSYREREGEEEREEEFNTVLFGVGRDPDVKELRLEKAGVRTDER